MLTENTKGVITGDNCIIFLFNIKYNSLLIHCFQKELVKNNVNKKNIYVNVRSAHNVDHPCTILVVKNVHLSPFMSNQNKMRNQFVGHCRLYCLLFNTILHFVVNRSSLLNSNGSM